MSQMTSMIRSLPLAILLGLSPLILTASSATPSVVEPSEPDQITLSLSWIGQGATEPEVVTFPLHIYIESEVSVEVRDAWGEVVFNSDSNYPEGDREIRVSMGRMEEGLYFVRVGTDLEELSEMVIIDRAQP